ncbi:Transcription activator of gluconeogenesis [Venturia inaequalis]|nr:Transcription activator of gluconeogenesis [Venturia inaequalis]
MKLVSVVLVVSISGAVSGHAWPEVNGENAAAKRLVFGALASEYALAPCKCAIPRECGTAPNSCECFNNAAVVCWVQQGQNCRLELQNCGSPATSPNSQFPPCLVATGSSANPLPPCAATASCRKMDNSCRDGISGSSCIGVCVPTTLVAGPRQPAPKAGASNPKPSTQSGSTWSWSNKPQSQPAGQAAPPGPNWGTPGAPPPPPPPVANAPGPAGTSWSPPPGGPPSAAIPRPAQEHVLTGYIIAPQAPPAPAFSAPAPQANPPAPPPPQAQPLAPAPPSAEAQYVGACPGTIKCPGNNVCTPDPKNKSSFLCIQPLEQCAGIQSQQCQGGKTCVADPRIQCKGQACTGLCV